MTTELKNLSLDVVNTVLEFLILTFGSTTTLDVKNTLRKLGFGANQDEVSDYMDTIAEMHADEDYEYFLNGEDVVLTFENKIEKGKSFRIYSFKTLGVIDEVIEDKAPVVTPSKPTKVVV